MGRPWSAVSGLALAVEPLSRALGPAKENIYALESLKGDIVWGCWELKRKSQYRFNDEEKTDETGYVQDTDAFSGAADVSSTRESISVLYIPGFICFLLIVESILGFPF